MGFLAAIPYLAMAIVVQCGGQLADWLRSRWRVETTTVRQLFTNTNNNTLVNKL